MTATVEDSGGASSSTGHVVLVGLMGSGKSSVGRLVAEALGRDFVDVDTLIEASTGRTVRQLWAEGGEQAYRPLERQVVVDALARTSPVVLAAPGGAIDDEDLVSRLSVPRVFVAWLRAEVGTLAARISADQDRRPLVGRDPQRVLTEQSAARSGRYQAVADLILDVDDQAPAESAGLIVAALGGDGNGNS